MHAKSKNASISDQHSEQETVCIAMPLGTRAVGAHLETLQLSKAILDTVAARELCWLKWAALCTRGVLSLLHTCLCRFKRRDGVVCGSLELVPPRLDVL
jgi:hypothetical protein